MRFGDLEQITDGTDCPWIAIGEAETDAASSVSCGEKMYSVGEVHGGPVSEGWVSGALHGGFVDALRADKPVVGREGDWEVKRLGSGLFRRCTPGFCERLGEPYTGRWPPVQSETHVRPVSGILGGEDEPVRRVYIYRHLVVTSCVDGADNSAEQRSWGHTMPSPAEDPRILLEVPSPIMSIGQVLSGSLQTAVERVTHIAKEVGVSRIDDPHMETDPENEDDWWLAIPVLCEGPVEQALSTYASLKDQMVATLDRECLGRIRIDLQIDD